MEMAKTWRSAVAAQPLPLHQHFGTWADVNGYVDAVPYFWGFYDTFIEKHASEMDQHIIFEEIPCQKCMHECNKGSQDTNKIM
jgi:hypothetical protein